MHCLRLFAFVLMLAAAVAQAAPPRLAWKQAAGTLALTCDEHVVWQFNYREKEGKPFFHPLCVAGGPSLTDLRPADHPWHLALWFSWKFINGLNYWEQDRKTGKSQGVSEVTDVKLTPGDDHSARIELTLAYHPPGKPALLTESRLLTVTPPAVDGAWSMDWTSRFTAGASEVQLTRTPILGEPGGVGYGGYAGLSLRLAPALKTWQFAGADGPVSENHARSRWMTFSGSLEGGRAATIAVLEHPQSFRQPTPWYLINRMPYFSPAVLYHGGYTLPARQEFTLKYRLLFRPGQMSHDAVEAQWREFAGK